MRKEEVKELSETAWRAMIAGAETLEVAPEIVHALAQGAYYACEEQGRIWAALALLDDPKPGTTVVLSSGEVWEYQPAGEHFLVPMWLFEDPEVMPFVNEAMIGVLREAVKGGAKVVSPVSVPAQEDK